MLKANVFGARDELTRLTMETNVFGAGEANPKPKVEQPSFFIVQIVVNTTRVITVNITTPNKNFLGNLRITIGRTSGKKYLNYFDVALCINDRFSTTSTTTTTDCCPALLRVIDKNG